MNPKPRIVITGFEPASPIGNSPDTFFENIRKNRSGTSRLSCMKTDSFKCNLAGEVQKEDWNEDLTDRDDRKARFLEYALNKIFLKHRDTIEKYDPTARILSLGTGIDYVDLPGIIENLPDMLSEKFNFENYYFNTYDLAKSQAKKFGIEGVTSVNLATCVASGQAIGFGYRYLKRFPDSLVFAGGFDSMLNYPQYLGFERLGTFSSWPKDPSEACRPFDRKRSGLVLGEGAAMLLLESDQNAKPENILAEIKGFAASMDGYLVTDPDPSGVHLAKAGIQAIEKSGLQPQDIDCVHLHGTGTFKNDPAEAKAMEIIFGETYKDIPVFSLKGHIGHSIGACSALEMGGVIYSIQNAAVPVTANYKEEAPDVGLRAVKNEELKMDVRNVLKLNANIGGQNSALVVSKYEA